MDLTKAIAMDIESPPPRGVQGVVLDAALLLSSSKGDGSLHVDPHAEKLLYRLSYSNLRLGILFRNYNDDSYTLEKECIVKSMPLGRLLDSKNSDDGSLSEVLKEFTLAWDFSVDRCIFLTDFLEDSLKSELINQGWYICLPLESTSSHGSGSERTINHIQELFCHIARINKEVCHDVIIVGYTMKWSREIDFLKRGAFPLHPIDKNVSFFPMNLELPLPKQFEVVDVMLHKPTDEIISITLGQSDNLEEQIKFTDAMQQSIRYLSNHPRICVVDPIERIRPLLDRAVTQEILLGLSELKHTRIRAPRFLTVAKSDILGLPKMLKDSEFPLPAIVKPQMACGVPDAHIMAVVFKLEGFLNLAVPTPSTIQEYIDHGSRLYKFYVIGDKVFYSIRKSTPNAAKLAESASYSNIPDAIVFDSLKSLPVHFVKDDPSISNSLSSNDTSELDLQLVHAGATWLRERLKLTIFGFDVVVQLNTHDHVIVDVNFFPTFKDIEEQKAIPAFWDALYRAYILHKEALCVPS